VQKRVVIAGGGYAGVRALQRLSVNKELEIILVDKHPYHYLQTEAYALIANEATLTDVTVDLVALCKNYANARFMKGQVRDVDFDRKIVTLEENELSYDYLVLAMGSQTDFSKNIPGLGEFAHGVKTLHRSFELKQQFEYQLYERMQSEEDLFCRAFNVVIGGAGLSGVEIAAEMGHFAERFLKENRMMCDGIQIHLIASRGEVLHGTDPYLISHARRRLEKLGVNIVYNCRITKVTQGCVYLDGNRSIDFDFMIFAGGITAPPITRKLASPINRKGQLLTKRTLQLPNDNCVYALGDIAELTDAAGVIIPPTANAAEQSGIVAARNILAQLRGERPQHAYIYLQGMMVALGGWNAAVVLFGRIRFSGLLGYGLKKMITWRYKFRLDRDALKAFRAQKKNHS
jgi:NADH dehydrogenase